MNSNSELFLRPLPFLDSKWLKADLIACLRNREDTDILWNHLIQDCELVSSQASFITNSAGNLSYLRDDGKHYCGAEKLTCSCCVGFCGPLSGCNCQSCRQLDSDAAIKKFTVNQNLNTTSAEQMFESWLWGNIPSDEQKSKIYNTLLSELKDISLQAAGNSQSSIYLKQELFIYQRYFIAMARTREKQKSIPGTSNFKQNQSYIDLESLGTASAGKVVEKDSDRATLGLARVGIKAALNFSFAFLRKAWRSGEDMDLCSELLSEALESLQDLPDALLFDTSHVSPIWLDVVERSIKFLRQVVIGDICGRSTVPKEDRNLALCLLLELNIQKGTLVSSLESLVLLLQLWEKEKETEDNRGTQTTGAPLVKIIKRYEAISKQGGDIPTQSQDSSQTSATESFLRFLTLPENESANVDLKKTGVAIISHLNRLAKPLMPTPSMYLICNSSASKLHQRRQKQKDKEKCEDQQKVFALGWPSLNTETYGFTTPDPILSAENTSANETYPFYSAPTFNFNFQIKQVVYSEEKVLFLSKDNEIYSWSANKPEIEPVPFEHNLCESQNIVSLATHCEGKHYLAMDRSGYVFAWGCAEGGRLGLGEISASYVETPTHIQFLDDKIVAQIYCGCTYSACLTVYGELYTWGRGTYGRLGHGNSDDKLTPTLVQALEDYKIVDVALGSGDSHTLCVTSEGLVFAWGDGDYGKLGNGSCNGSQLPVLVPNLPKIEKVYAGSQFSVALSKEGKIYTWGKGMGGRLGHINAHGIVQGITEVVSTPKLVSTLENKVITEVSVGVAHCLAMSSTGEVYGWGRNDYQQICPQSISKDSIIPTPILATHPYIKITGISCGSTQSILWSQVRSEYGFDGIIIEPKMPFIIDLSEQSFRLLDQLLSLVCGPAESSRLTTPNQESECVAVGCLNLLRLQLHALITNHISPKSVGLGNGSRMLLTLNTRILNLACGGSGILKTMQEAAQWTLQVGWSVLLPTASERAQTLTTLLPSEPSNSTSGHRFMTDLLVGSLMADGGLEIALNQAIHENSDIDVDNYNNHNLPLLHLIKQLLKNNSSYTQTRLSLLLNYCTSSSMASKASDLMPEQTNPSLDLLHRFQLLLLSYIHQSKTEDIHSAEVLLSKYVQCLITYSLMSISKAHEVALLGKDGINEIMLSDISDTLLYELLIGLILLTKEKPEVLASLNWNKTFVGLLNTLDKFNRVVTDSDIQDSDDMGWPGIVSRGNQKVTPIPDEPILIRKSDFENQISDGGKWIILHGYVCDIEKYECENPSISEILINGIGKDLTHSLSNNRTIRDYIVNNLKVGKYSNENSSSKYQLNHTKVRTHIHSERALAYLLGLKACILQIGPPLQPAELQCKSILNSEILSGGLQVLQPSNPFDEEKGEARSSASTAGSTPTTEQFNQIVETVTPQASLQQRIDNFLTGLGDGRLTDPLVCGWNAVFERFCKENSLIWHQEFPHEHPVQELERLLSAVFIRHLNLGPLALAVIDRELGGVTDKPPKQICEIIRLVYQTKWTVVRTRQQLNRSYKEVCVSILERLRFLLFEVRPAISLEQNGLKKLPLLYKESRFKNLVNRIIFEIRSAKNQMACAKPEDILNVTIQSQNVANKNLMNYEDFNKEPTPPLEISSLNDINDLISIESSSTDKNLSGNENEKKPPTSLSINSSGELKKKTPKQFTENEQIFINDVILKLSENTFRNTNGSEILTGLMNQIVDFVIQNSCDVETVRRAMYCQIQRYENRLKGLEMFSELLRIHGLLDSAQYNMFNGYLGLFLNKPFSTDGRYVLDDLNLITAYQKANLIIAQSKILEWSINEFQKLVNQEQIGIKIKGNGHGKDTSNLGTYVFLKKLPRARFLLAIFGMLCKKFDGNELSLLINSGIIGTIMGLLRQTGGGGNDMTAQQSSNEMSVVYEDTILKQKMNKTNLTGPELAKLMKIGTRICRGQDWKWGDQDGNPPGEGRIISEVGDDGWVRVEWDTGTTNSYRMGKENQYDLKLADSASNIVSPDTESENNYGHETIHSVESHPTKLLRIVCMKLFQIISVGVSKYNQNMHKSAIHGITSAFRTILCKSGLSNISIIGMDKWTTLGFFRAIVGDSKTLSNYLTETPWINHFIELVEQTSVSEIDVYRKVQCLRLLQIILMNCNWSDGDRCESLIKLLFATLGKITLYCPNDLSLNPLPKLTTSTPPHECSKSNIANHRVLLTASHSGTVAEEVINLLRKLHTIPVWNDVINSFLSQKFCVVADYFSEKEFIESTMLTSTNFDNEKIFLMGSLNLMGGYDRRPRIGLQIKIDNTLGTICGFTNKGKCLYSSESVKSGKCSLTEAQINAEYSVFSLSRLPINEMLLNSWSVLLFGPGERKECIPNYIDIQLLHSQMIHLGVLNANCILHSHQSVLRKILMQRSPSITTTYSSDESLSGEYDTPPSTHNNELLIHTILCRATQPSPLKATYSYEELARAALNVTQMLASQIYLDTVNNKNPKVSQPVQATFVHGVLVYNTDFNNAKDKQEKLSSNNETLINQIVEMGFTRESVEAAIKGILAQSSETIPTAELIVPWILEHPEVCAYSSLPVMVENVAGNTSVAAYESDVEDSEKSNESQERLNKKKFMTRENFQSDDQYALYVRENVKPGMIVKCCCTFEEINIGDTGSVIKVDAEGLHDLNVQVDWKNHGNTYWVCFDHIELLQEPVEQPKSSSKGSQITVGSSVKLKPQISTPRYKWGLVNRDSIGTVVSIQGKEVVVNFTEQENWTGCVDEMQLVPSPQSQSQNSSQNKKPYDEHEEYIIDWSRCIHTLAVSSNESSAKNLLDKAPNYWQTSCPSTPTNGQGKHWIRLKMHENIVIQNLSIVVSPQDYSHQPSLIVTRVGDTQQSMKEYSWISVKNTDTNVTLLTELQDYYKWIEISVKQCRNNGIQCRIHRLNIIGRYKPNDLDLMLINAGILACEYDTVSSPLSYLEDDIPKPSTSSVILNEPPCTVMVWGLNDKEQLGGLKGSKVKIPTFSQSISRLRPICIAGGSKSLFVVSEDGKVYACGEGTNGRLGLGHNCNVATPRQIPVLHQYVVKKVAVHSGGKHALALTLDGKVFAWGEGEDGKLGLGNRLTMDKPRIIDSLLSKKIRDIACGSSHSAAITSSGELYTWGLGEYGRLGHGDNYNQYKPKLVQSLVGKRIIQVACGSRDAQTLALTEDGIVYSWGDGDFGKLGRGGSEGSMVPHEIERLTGIGVVQIECGAQFSLALTRSGEVWTWGKGDYFRLGHGTDQHVRKPAPIQGLRGKKIIHVAVGALHCLAVDDNGQVYAWGDNDHGQQGSGNTQVNKKPSLVVGLDKVFVNRVACGSSHSIAWGLPQSPIEEGKKGPVPFLTTKDPLGGNSLGIYDSEVTPNISTPISKQSSKQPSLSEIIMSLETLGARQTALNYILNAMSIIQARHLIVSSLTSHSKVNVGDKYPHDMTASTQSASNLNNMDPGNMCPSTIQEEIAQGGGEAPADNTDPVIQEPSPTEIGQSATMSAAMSSSAGPLSAFQSLTGSLSLSSVSSCGGTNPNQKLSKMSTSAMSVIMAATMTHEEQMIEAAHNNGLDDFTALLTESEAKSLIELLKLNVAGRFGLGSQYTNSWQTISDTLIALASNSSSISSMLIETCITELEDLCTSRQCLFGKMPKSVIQETSHPYVDDVTLTGHVRIPGAEALRLEFDTNCSTEKRNDPLVIFDGAGRIVATRSGRELAQWTPEIRIPGDEMRWKFTSDSSVNGWGWKFWVHPIMPSSFLQESGSDRSVLSQPSMSLVMALLDSKKINPGQSTVLIRLASALAQCSQLNSLTPTQRIWSLKKLHSILNSKNAPKHSEPVIVSILTPLIPEIYHQYEYEEPQVRGGMHLMHSEYFKTLVALACDMQLDSLIPQSDLHKWSWFRRYCTAVRVAQSLVHRVELPQQFCVEVRKKISEMLPSPSNVTIGTSMTTSSTSLSSSSSNNTPQPVTPSNFLTAHNLNRSCSNTDVQDLTEQCSNISQSQFVYIHEDHNLFKSEHDSQLLQWLNRRPEDWALSWGGASTIYGWGHNHRGQLGGLEGSRIKSPTPCEALSLLRPVQLAGGEQTLYAVTPDGKLFATGYGAGGRLGIGGTDSVATPTLVESLQHVFIKKVAVNSGGKHCLALTTDGEVFSWGEGEDGKLGHGNRMSYDRPKLIESLSGIGIVDIACGSAHSACITSSGQVLTWGKGRYGRLGHGDSEDQLRPKPVEALLCYRAVDIACGSGDAQTLCITDDDNVWSWGDGDYGKLGRGGSDGCKVPMKIESLSGLGVTKVECGSQFSVALTKSGAVYTFGKGDYHRLGHGNTDHVRRPKKIAALQGKKIISISTGSLHCVACSDTGEVFTWGDNDEGQLGDGTVSAIQRPRLVTALQGKHIVKVTCGSAHTLALSTSQLSEAARPPPNPPIEYDLVGELSPDALHARLVLLHHFSELICPCLSMLPISGDLSLTALKDVLVYSIKEAAFRKVIQTTMVRDKQHGPVIELNRIQVKRSRSKSGNGLAGVDGMKSVFGQMVQKLPLLTQEALSLPHRVWKVKFVGESVDDCGGGYSESIAEMCDELQNGCVPLLIGTPNGRGEAGANRDCFLLDPTLISVLQMNMFRFLGVLMGIAIRTGSPLSLNLAEPVWRQLAGEELRPSDLTEVDRDYVAGLLYIRDMENDPKVFSSLELPFTTSSAKGHEVPLSNLFMKICPENRHEYVRLALNFRLHEFDEQVKAVRDGMSKVVPVPLLSLFSASELQAMVCGSPDIPLSLLKSVATYKGVDPNSSLIQWFWEVMEEFSNQERSLFLRFVWGRTRLPRTIADFRGRDFVVQVLDKYNPPDHFLPESYTCFFLLKMPRYSCKMVLLEKLKYAIHFCKSIDTDEYARVAMGDPTEATGSEDNSDLESVASHDI